MLSETRSLRPCSNPPAEYRQATGFLFTSFHCNEALLSKGVCSLGLLFDEQAVAAHSFQYRQILFQIGAGEANHLPWSDQEISEDA